MAETDTVATKSSTLTEIQVGSDGVTEKQTMSDVAKPKENGIVGEIMSDGEVKPQSPAKVSASTLPIVEIQQATRPPSSTPIAGSTTISSPPAPPHPKKFSASNINKKFLEKNLSSSQSQSSPNSLITKSSGSVARPASQPTSSHSRLVTAKLTAPSQSSLTGPGWSRPTSSTPPANPSIPPNNLTSTSQLSTSNSTQPPLAGKVIQPQPRSSAFGDSLKDSLGGSKLVWASARAGAGSKPVNKTQNDFPTAAEVEQVRQAKLSEKRDAEESAAALRQSRAEEADTFRGVHLDPNAHHWDDMEEDDDGFLDKVIEFGDGRQYKIESTETPCETPPPNRPPPRSSQEEVEVTAAEQKPVSKEERFADDFDRSWPRSKPSPAQPARDFPPTPTSPASSHTVNSPQDSSRVLFNERSNRLEPYWHTNNRRDNPLSPNDSKVGNDPTPGPNGVQVLQKPSTQGELFARSRGFSNSSSNADWSRDTVRQETVGQQNRRAYPSGPTSGGFANKDRDYPRGRNMAPPPPPPPPPPSQPLRSPRGNMKQLPPRSSQFPPAQKTSFFRELTQPDDSHSPRVPTFPTQSPTLSHISLTRSPIAEELSLPSDANIDEVRKDVMQSAAARAKQRRLQEEEERQKVMERAKAKAAELAAKAKATETKSKPMDKVDEIIQEAMGSVAVSPSSSQILLSPLLPFVPQPFGRPPSLRGTTRQRSDSQVSNSRLGQPPTTGPAATAQTWRIKIGTAPQTLERHAPFGEQPEPLAVPGEELEVVDFSELGNFLGAPAETSTAPEHGLKSPPLTKAGRAVASDFFDDPIPREPPVPSKSEASAWRRKASIAGSENTSTLEFRDPAPLQDVRTGNHTKDTPSSSPSFSRPALHPETPHRGSFGQSATSPPSNGSQRTPRSHKEAKMSALDDAMSRIKGALDGIASETSREQAASHDLSSSLSPVIPKPALLPPPIIKPPAAREQKWIPPALRTRNFDFDHASDTFAISIPPLPSSPNLSPVQVSLPRIRRPPPPVSKNQLQLFHRPPPRKDFPSWEPPIEGMKHHISVNDFLFSLSPFYKGFIKARVIMPRSRKRPNFLPGGHQPTGSKSPAIGSFGGKPKEAEVQSTWRRPTALPSPVLENDVVELAPEDTLPETPTVSVFSTIGQDQTSPKSDTHRHRAQPKMPVGSGVAFYRNSRIDAVEANSTTSVNFVVTSELDESGKSEQRLEVVIVQSSSEESSRLIGSDAEVTSTSESGDFELKSQPSSPQPKLPASALSKTGSPDDLMDRALNTPSSHLTNGLWAKTPHKESPARPPDPEHIKAVWQQASGKAQLPAGNSLEKIGDDLTAIPFILQDVKSEDGSTPPPQLAQAAPSRMSLSDVTKAFQQVPAPSSASASHQSPARSPSIASIPMQRQPPSATYQAYPSRNPNVRTVPYPPYHSPMMNPAQTPTVVYQHNVTPSPVPSRMVPAAIYGQPVWMAIPPGSPAPQTPATLVRPHPGSPYPSQLVPYPHSGAPAMPMYPPSPAPMQNMPLQNSESQRGGRNAQQMLGPMVSHAIPHPGGQMYGSPVLVPTQAMPVVHQPSSYMMPAGRGQGRNDVHPSHQPLQHTGNHPPGQNVRFTPVQQTQFARPSW